MEVLCIVTILNRAVIPRKILCTKLLCERCVYFKPPAFQAQTRKKISEIFEESLKSSKLTGKGGYL